MTKLWVGPKMGVAKFKTIYILIAVDTRATQLCAQSVESNIE